MKTIVKIWLVSLGILFSPVEVFCQEEDTLFEVGTPDEEVLSFYENLRIGASWLEMGNYAKSYHFLKKACELQPADTAAQRLFAVSSRAMNRRIPTRWRGEGRSIYVEGSWNHTSDDVDPETDYLATQYFTMGESVCAKADFTHRAGRLWELRHSVGFQNSPYQHSLRVSDSEVKTSFLKTQSWDYGLQAEVLLPKDFRLSLGGRFIFARHESVSFVFDSTGYSEDPWMDMNGWQQAKRNSYWDYFDWDDWYHDESGDEMPSGSLLNYYRDDFRKENKISYSVNLAVGKIYKQHEFSVMAGWLHYWRYQAYQVGCTYLWYPFGNMNLYFRTNLTFLSRNEQENDAIENVVYVDGKGKRSNFLAEELVGFKMAKILWTEAAFLYGNLKGYEDSDANIVYLSAEDTRMRALLRFFLFTGGDLRWVLSYKFTVRETTSVGVDEQSFYISKRRVFDNLLSVGVKWNF